jgi:hypothetical protein
MAGEPSGKKGIVADFAGETSELAQFARSGVY